MPSRAHLACGLSSSATPVPPHPSRHFPAPGALCSRQVRTPDDSSVFPGRQRLLVEGCPGGNGTAMADRLNQAMRMAVQQSPLSPEERKMWLLWCCETATERCHWIVSQSLSQGGHLCGALSRNRCRYGWPVIGENLVYQVRQRYPRHTASRRSPLGCRLGGRLGGSSCKHGRRCRR